MNLRYMGDMVALHETWLLWIGAKGVIMGVCVGNRPSLHVDKWLADWLKYEKGCW